MVTKLLIAPCVCVRACVCVCVCVCHSHQSNRGIEITDAHSVWLTAVVTLVRYHSSGIGTGHGRLCGVGVKVQEVVAMVTNEIECMTWLPSNDTNRLW